MNLPNLITLPRIPLMLAVIGLLYPWTDETWSWIRTSALLLFLFAALTDWLDGWLARKFGQVSEFGKFMDALSDKVLVLLILSREFLITGLRLVAAGKGKTLAAEKVGKLKTIVQLTCISLYLGKIALEADFKMFFVGEEKLHLELVEILEYSGHLTLLAATFITVFSGIVYLSKYWKFFLDEDS
jgi:CDP-diacylglycerol--glycerol-3-phosphate 3-phosphatidyltransferase